MLTCEGTAAGNQECTEGQCETSECWVSLRRGGDTKNTKGQTSCASKDTSL